MRSNGGSTRPSVVQQAAAQPAACVGERAAICHAEPSVAGHSVRVVEYRSGLTRYDVQRDPFDHRLEPVLPAETGPVHAVPISPRDRRVLRAPEFLDPELGYATAVCGTTVKVVLPMTFDAGDEDSCRRCVGPALRGEDAPHRRYDEPAGDRLEELIAEVEAQRTAAQQSGDG
jgi:hypothetical protein